MCVCFSSFWSETRGCDPSVCPKIECLCFFFFVDTSNRNHDLMTQIYRNILWQMSWENLWPMAVPMANFKPKDIQLRFASNVFKRIIHPVRISGRSDEVRNRMQLWTALGSYPPTMTGDGDTGFTLGLPHYIYIYICIYIIYIHIPSGKLT